MLKIIDEISRIRYNVKVIIKEKNEHPDKWVPAISFVRIQVGHP